MWSEKNPAKHLNQHPCPDVRRSVLRVMPWKCMLQGLYETFTDYGRKECSTTWSTCLMKAVVETSISCLDFTNANVVEVQVVFFYV